MATITQENITGTTYTVIPGDAGKVKRSTNGSETTVSVEDNATQTLSSGDVVNIYAASNDVIVNATAGVTFRGLPDDIVVPQYQEVSLRYDGSDEWHISGAFQVFDDASVSTTDTIEFAPEPITRVNSRTMTAGTTFSFGTVPSGEVYSMVLELDGAFTPVFPSEIVWDSATAPTYSSPTVYVFWTRSAHNGTVFGSVQGTGFA